METEGGNGNEKLCSQFGAGGTPGAWDGPDQYTCMSAGRSHQKWGSMGLVRPLPLPQGLWHPLLGSERLLLVKNYSQREPITALPLWHQNHLRKRKWHCRHFPCTWALLSNCWLLGKLHAPCRFAKGTFYPPPHYHSETPSLDLQAYKLEDFQQGICLWGVSQGFLQLGNYDVSLPSGSSRSPSSLS